MRALLIEDSRSDAALVREHLADAGPDVEVLVAESLAAAVALLAETSVECVLLDLSLPDAAGLDGLRELAYVAPGLPVVVLTGTDTEALAVEAVRAGAQDYLVKGEAPGPVLVRALRHAVERGRAQRELAHRALTDPLTGLPNRALLLDRLELALARTRRTGARVGLLICDLDGFKSVIDRHGYAAGDRLLVEVARRLCRAVRPSDTVARLGGDEFVVLCDDLADARPLDGIAERLRAVVGEPLRVADETLSPSISVGSAVAGGPDDPPERLLRDADAAMYRAKRGAIPGGGIGEDVTRVFLCDDVPDLRGLLRAFLEDGGAFAVVGEAGDGGGLPGAVAAAGADVVLLDLSMPDVDGLEAIAALRAADRGLGIVVLSGFEQARMEAQALALGADRYLEKRAGMAEVRRTVAEVAAERRGR